MKENSFLKGAVILSLAGIISKVLGAIYRIPFARIVGDEGVGLYQMAYPFYTIILALSTAGIPLAISKLVAERYYQNNYLEIKRVFRVSLIMLFLIGSLASLGLFLGADFISVYILHEPKAALSLKAIAPAVLLTSLMATFRGYFQGFQTMTPTAVSQVLEQVVRVTTVFVATFYLLPRGIEYAAAGAIFGAATGGFAALLFLILIFLVYNHKNKVQEKAIENQRLESRLVLARKIVYLAIPISIGGLVLPLMQAMDAALVPVSLQLAGYPPLDATSLYGQLSGMAGAIINLPFIITTALAASLIPAITTSVAAGQFKQTQDQLATALKLALIIVFPAAVGLWVLAVPICDLLYALPEAGVSLRWLAPTVLGVGIYQTSAAALQGLNKPLLPVISLLLGAFLKGVLTFTLTAWTTLGIKGAALGTVLGFAVAALNNIVYLNRHLGREWFIFREHLLKPFWSVILMALAVMVTYNRFLALGIGNSFSTLLAIVLGAGLYFIMLFAVGSITGKDLEGLPKYGATIASFLRKIRLVRD